MQIVTFDFHNTIAYCDPWFQLEIRTLPAAVLERMPGASTVSNVEERYRALRQEVIATGIECDAVTGVSRVFTELSIQHDELEVAGHVDSLMRECLDAMSPVSGARETISALADQGIPVGVISSAVYHPFLEWALERFGIRDRLVFVATSASIGYYKSVTTIYEHAYGLVGADPALGVHIGDSPRWDVDTARRAGLATVLYQPDAREVAGDKWSQPDLVLESLVDACQPIASLLNQRHTEVVA